MASRLCRELGKGLRRLRGHLLAHSVCSGDGGVQVGLEMGCLKTGVWTCLGMDLGGCPFTVTLSHRKASVHSTMALLPTVNMAGS